MKQQFSPRRRDEDIAEHLFRITVYSPVANKLYWATVPHRMFPMTERVAARRNAFSDAQDKMAPRTVRLRMVEIGRSELVTKVAYSRRNSPHIYNIVNRTEGSDDRLHAIGATIRELPSAMTTALFRGATSFRGVTSTR